MSDNMLVGLLGIMAAIPFLVAMVVLARRIARGYGP